MAIDLLVIPVLVLILAAWGALAVGLVRRVLVNGFRIGDRANRLPFFDLIAYWSELRSSFKPFSIGRPFLLFYRRPVESMLAWAALAVAGMLTIALWSVLIVAIFGHYP